MKKISLILAVMALCLTSCKKDYVCECTVSTSVSNSDGTFSKTKTTAKRRIPKATKKQARPICGNTTVTNESSYSDTQGMVHNSTDTHTETCKLKG